MYREANVLHPHHPNHFFITCIQIYHKNFVYKEDILTSSTIMTPIRHFNKGDSVIARLKLVTYMGI